MRPDRAAAGFDSATAMLRALSLYLRGQDVPLTGELPGRVEPVATAVVGAANRLPRPVKEWAYAASGWWEAIPEHRVGEVDSDAMARWVTGHYPPRETDVAFVGSANGALVHLAAALDAPWLPQTMLVPVRRFGVPPEDGQEDLRRMRPTGERLLEANPDWILHHMHDPNQDRLMISGMTYFRPKWRRLPDAYRRFLRSHLAPGGTLVVSDCAMRWPTTRVDDRYVFQHGGQGGATLDELREGGDRVRRYLRAYGSPYRRWVAPEPDGESPEAEWGFEPALLTDLRRLATEQGWELVRLRHDEPENLSPPVADLYRDWYRRRGVPDRRLLAESFMLVEPYWTLRTGSVPFWMVFNKETSLRALEAYLDSREAFEEIRLILFSHGVESVGLATPREWREALGRATRSGMFLGTDPERFPRDFAVLARAHRELTRVPGRFPLPRRLTWGEVTGELAGEGVEELPVPEE